MNTTLNIRLQNRTDNSIKKEPEVNKYIVIGWNHREQVVAFPFNTQHADMFSYIQREHPDIKAISAGFFMADNEALWVGGESLTLNLNSREQDKELIKRFLTSADRATWDLTLIGM
jgi:hypothetical protein